MAIDDTLSDIRSWLNSNAAITATGLLPPATEGDIRAASATTGFDWPQELRSLYLFADGAPSFDADDTYIGGLLPRPFLSLSDALEERRWPLENRGPGSENDDFVAAFFPFSALDGCFNFVDLRTGTVGYWDDVDGPSESVWSSLDAYFADVLTSLRSGSVFEEIWTPAASDGILEWE
jgi:hypothetical protein